MTRRREIRILDVPADALHVRLAGAYPVDRLDRLLRDLAQLIELEEPRVVWIDVSGLVAVSPTALALITAVIKHASSAGLLGNGSAFVPPRSALVLRYLQRMDVFRLLGFVGMPEEFERNEPIGFRPCRQFRGVEECVATARDLLDALVERCSVDQIGKASIRICLDEIAENVLHHADTELGGFAAAQAWPKKNAIEIAIVDLGIGIRASLNKNPAYADIADDLRAITTALRPRVSSTPERNSGIGLFVTRLLLQGNGGLLVIRSGSGAVYSGSQEQAVTAANFPGTMVTLRVRIDRPLDINDVYRRLDHDEDDHDDQTG